MCVPVSGVSRDTRTQESKHVCEFLRSLTCLEPMATGGELWFACEGTGVSTDGRAHSSHLFFAVRTKDSNNFAQVFFSRESLDMCSTDSRDLESQPKKKNVNAWISARRTTIDHDLASVSFRIRKRKKGTEKEKNANL